MKPIDIVTGGKHSESIRKGLCTTCGKLIRGFIDEISFREYKISGMCQTCQNSVFK